MERFITVERIPSQLSGYPPGSFLPHELAWPPVGTDMTGEHADDPPPGAGKSMAAPLPSILPPLATSPTRRALGFRAWCIAPPCPEIPQLIE
jgi:hypothetical protein